MTKYVVYTVHFVVRPRHGAACRIKAACLAVDSEQLTAVDEWRQLRRVGAAAVVARR